ncbi:phosphate ABC transporter substrate-binding protein [Dissulfurispira thermophila]|uniref:Phosphate ABC transporter substrate-binding protein n=1 Tax=Dissulfurispira thermophila TaxID=2715679 RepID=A0A7G1H0F7_9BACT|nr:phosphate ABC transporter substrate-binding protein [Dissulfurispira thermophila]
MITLFYAANLGAYSVEATLKISGSSTIQSLAEDVANLYKQRYGQPIDVQGGGTDAGIRNTIKGISDIGMVSRALKRNEKSKLHYTTIGFDAVAIIVNVRNPLKEINRTTLITIYNGTIKNWKEITSWDQPITIISKQTGRSTLEVFEEYTGLKHHLHGRGINGNISKDVYEAGSNIEAATLVGGMPGAIGYVSAGTAMLLIEKGMPIKILALDGIAATRDNVINGTYPVRRELNLVYRKYDKRIINYLGLFMSIDGQEIVKAQGFIPVRKDR